MFDVTKNNLYEKLNEYDVLLLPAKWKGESCVGVLIKAKMSGFPSIISDFKYNIEIVSDGKEGFVVGNNLAEGFADAVKRIAEESGAAVKVKSRS